MTTKGYRGIGMEGPIATWYAKITRGDRGYAAIADDIARALPPGARVLEVAPGPGYLAIELARRGLRVSAVDISRSFVRMVGDNARAAGVAVDVRHGNASQLPFGDAAFDHVVCRAAFKNFADPLGALDEAYRVLAPGGVASIFDLRKEATRDEIRAEVDAMKLSWWNALWTRWTFRHVLLGRAYTDAAIRALAERSAFGGGEVRHGGVGFELRAQKPAAQA
ncbi:MAG TPA: class I SAM-dependent methyltransferase [Kofleriaceae bacterium]|nr:class I SAM-dependent methyltransferase [Kofleriaceae bacterium]